MTRIKTLAAGLGCAALIATAAPAGAVAAQTTKSAEGGCVSLKGARGCFIPDGDIIIVEDKAADGYHVSVEWKTSYGRKGVCKFSGNSSQQRCNYNLRENQEIQFRVVMSNGHRFTKSHWAYMYTSS